MSEKLCEQTSTATQTPVDLSHDPWLQLWNMATGEPGEPAKIEVDPETPDTVHIAWPDGSHSTYMWKGAESGWRISNEPLSLCPCDVAARDTL